MKSKIKIVILFLLACLTAGCAIFPVEKHMVIEGRNISTPYGKGDVIKISRDVFFGLKNKKQLVTPTVDEEAVNK